MMKVIEFIEVVVCDWFGELEGLFGEYLDDEVCVDIFDEIVECEDWFEENVVV